MPKISKSPKSDSKKFDKEFNPIAKEAKAPPKPFVNFIHKLHNMVNDVDIPAISWNEEGNGIKILDTSYLCEKIFPTYFKHDCWASFTRQLNLYGFVRYTHGAPGEQLLMYKHPYFLRDQPEKLKSIHRRIMNSTTMQGDQYTTSKPKNEHVDVNQINSLQSYISELDAQCRHLKNDISYLHKDNRNLNQIIAHNQSTLRYVMDILSRSVEGSQNTNSELNVALHALQSTFNYNSGLQEGQHVNPANSSEFSSPNFDYLNPINPAKSKSTNSIKLPSIKFLL